MDYLKSFFVSTETREEKEIKNTSHIIGFENYIKTPVLLSIKDSKKKLLSHCHLSVEDDIEYNNEPDFAVFAGKVNNLLLIDFDTNKKTNFSTSKQDGIEWFQEKFGLITDMFGLVTETPSGGIHAYCLYTDELPDTAIGLEYKLEGDKTKSVAIDILSNGGVGFQGRYYKLIKNESIKPIPSTFLEFLKTLEYVPHSSCRDFYGSIYTLSSNKDFVDIKTVPGFEDLCNIEIGPSNILFFDTACDNDSELRRKPKMGLELTTEDKERLSNIDNRLIDYIFENVQKLVGNHPMPGRKWSRDTIENYVHYPIVKPPCHLRHNNERDNIYQIKLKLYFKDGFPLFKVFNKDGKPLDWIKQKRLDYPPTFDLSWTQGKVKVKARCEGLWAINRKVYCTLHATEIYLA